ncbi:DMT family transporter [Fodinicurvata sediminis]|uniref:DMT family transporter n=1 Tax=Fodinicurvata sediminis TaxID=1121832 RepID=UPI0003B4ACF5|nr:DMT family transporter [Fodinicurvata sediminis]
MSAGLESRADTAEPLGARALLLLVALVWGVNFVATSFALQGFSLWTFRTLSFLVGGLLLLPLARILGADLRVPSARDKLHLIVSGMFACGGFGALSALAIQLTATGRVAICIYTMPIWVVLLARIALKEALTPARTLSLTLCCLGLLILLWPLLQAGVSLGALAAIGGAISWAIGIVYLKWARIAAHPLTVAVYQIFAGALVSALGMLVAGEGFEGPIGLQSWFGLLYGVVCGTALGYLLWFRVLGRLPAGTAGLGVLLVPVFGVVASAILLGERPTPADLVGFVLILAAALVALRAPVRTA